MVWKYTYCSVIYVQNALRYEWVTVKELTVSLKDFNIASTIYIFGDNMQFYTILPVNQYLTHHETTIKYKKHAQDKIWISRQNVYACML